ncbi:hypothetical protein [Allokutzneria albata]|uniref:Uncharacterized protein n=1 Tax=Allokutzneria albata TaxID=211114 RepID=A0A1G9S4Y8_ALLAB|nr:hypothetical protein [Allokutzneria albata]SDM30377.1 hypothetical protein SAMN04489726_0885 [Allokutzneria albata]
MSKREGISPGAFLSGLGLVCVLLSYSRAEAGNTSEAVGYGIYAATCFLLLYAFVVPAKCGVITTKGGSCGHPAKGVLLGCRHIGYHRLAKLKARFGLHPVVPATRTTRSAAAPVERVVAVERNWREWVIFWVPVASFVVATVSMTTDVMGLFD